MTNADDRTRAGGAGPLDAGGRPPGCGWGGRPAAMRRGDIRRAILTGPPRGAGPRLRDHAPARGRSGGIWRPSPGSVYPTLQMLEDEGLVRSEDAGRHPRLRAHRGRAGRGRRRARPSGRPPRGSAATSDDRRPGTSARRWARHHGGRQAGADDRNRRADRAGHRDRRAGPQGALPACSPRTDPGNLRPARRGTRALMTHSPTTVDRPSHTARPPAASPRSSDRRPDQGLRRDRLPGRRRAQPDGRRRRDLRPARPERRRQDHHRRHAHHPGHPDLGHGLRRRHRRGGPPDAGQADPRAS